MKKFLALVFLVLCISCTKELLHEPGVPWLEIKGVDPPPLKEVEVSGYMETSVEALSFTLKAHEVSMMIPYEQFMLKAITSTRNVGDVVSSFRIKVGNNPALDYSANLLRLRSEVLFSPLVSNISLPKDSIICIKILMQVKRIDDPSPNGIYPDGTSFRVTLWDVRVFSSDSISEVKGVYGSAWSSWFIFSR